MTASYVLYGMPGSLYTAKVRSYLRKQRIAFEERVAGDPRFEAEAIPAVGRWIIPVVQTPQGQWLQDGADIIDHFEAHGLGLGPAALPSDHVLAVLARLLELFGGEGLLRAAMHYRWNFDTDNLAFLEADFISALAPAAGPEAAHERFLFASKRMRGACLAFGVTPATAPTVEASTDALMDLLNAHLAHTPYLLGSTPTVADYGLAGPLCGHLARDPYPAMRMKQHAPRVWRWAERMNAPDLDAGEYPGASAPWLDAGAPSASLLALLQFMADDYLPEITAHVQFANDWLAKRPELPAGSNGMPKPSDRHLGLARMQWRGHAVDFMVMPYRLYLLQGVQDAAAALAPAQTATLHALLQPSGLDRLLALRCRRRVLRHNHLEVWGPDLGEMQSFASA
jgi:glutathione S-transferase